MPKLKVRTADPAQVAMVSDELQDFLKRDLEFIATRNAHRNHLCDLLSRDQQLAVWTTDTYFPAMLRYALQFTSAAEISRATGFSSVQIGRWAKGGAPQLAVRATILREIRGILAGLVDAGKAEEAAAREALDHVMKK
jgi:hypothetical protein